MKEPRLVTMQEILDRAAKKAARESGASYKHGLGTFMLGIGPVDPSAIREYLEAQVVPETKRHTMKREIAFRFGVSVEAGKDLWEKYYHHKFMKTTGAAFDRSAATTLRKYGYPQSK